MKERLEDFIQSLTDKELAFFYEYRRTEFIPQSQDKIRSELKNRKLTDTKISELISAVVNKELGGCSRCSSNNFQEIKETELRSTSYGRYEVEINSWKCRICGYNPQKDKPINWRVRLNKFLGKYSWTRFK